MRRWVDNTATGGEAGWVEMTPEEVAAREAEEAAASTPEVPRVVSMRQAQLALLGASKLDAVEAAINGADRATQIWWRTSPMLDRGNAILRAMQTALGWSDAEVDALFLAAAALP